MAPSSSSFWASLKGFPDHQVDRVKWNEGFEKLIKSMEKVNFLESLLKAPDITTDDQLLVNHRMRLRDLCELQHLVTKNAQRCFALHDLQSRWVNSGPAFRQSHLLEGIVRSCLPPAEEDDRLYCNEVTLPYLQCDGGQGYLRLLKTFMLEDTTRVPEKPIILPNARFDYMFGRGKKLSTREIMLKEYFVVGRIQFLCLFLNNTLASFIGKPHTPPVAKKLAGPNRLPSTKEFDEMGVGFPRGLESFGQATHRDIKASRAEQVITCEHCSRFQDKDRSLHFRVCALCKSSLDRRIFYCSRSCQKLDWKRHKPICGKKMWLEDAVASSPDTIPNSTTTWKHPLKCGPAAPGYIRSPALQYQVSLLDDKPGLDYVLFLKAGDDPRAFFINNFTHKSFFWDLRQRALESGDREAVTTMAQFMVRSEENMAGLTCNHIMSQLEREYGFDVKAAVAELDKRKASDPHKRTEFENLHDDFMANMRDILLSPERSAERELFYKSITDRLKLEFDQKKP